MTTQTSAETRPPFAVVGSQVEVDEKIFGDLFDGKVARRFSVFLKPFRGQLIIAMVAVLAFTVTQLWIPLAIRDAIDTTVAGSDDGRRLLNIAVFGFFVVITVNYLANYMQLVIVGRIAEHVLFNLRRAMYAHLQRVSLSFMDKTEVGRLMSRLMGDVNAMQEFLETSVFAIGDLVLIVGIVAVLLVRDPVLGALTLSVVPILLIIRMFWLPRARRAFLYARETSSRTNGALAEGIHGVRTVQEMTRESVNAVLFDDKARENLNSHLRASQFSQIMVPTVDTLTGAAMAIVIIVGGRFVLGGSLDLGVMVAFLFYIQRFFDPIRSLTLQYSIMQRAMASGQRVFEVLDVAVAVNDKPDAVDPGVLDGSVEFRHVTFGYERDRPILSDVSFSVAPGETLALVGPTGSGKSSTAALAHRFYDVWDGEVRLGGHDVRDLTQACIGRNMAMVLQEPFLFTGSIRDNIRYNTARATDEDIEKAAQAVGAHDFIVALPDGYDTWLEQRGGNLSLGQRQLISFARALVADTKILVLDEATANIDSYTEMQIQQALKVLLKGRTALVIAHRLATIRGADRIVVLNEGRVAETGSHRDLVKAGGLYARMTRLSFASFDDLPGLDRSA